MSNSKYTPDQLQAMAQHAIKARDAGNPRYNNLVFQISFRMEISPQQVEDNIEKLARGEAVE